MPDWSVVNPAGSHLDLRLPRRPTVIGTLRVHVRYSFRRDAVLSPSAAPLTVYTSARSELGFRFRTDPVSGEH